MSNNAVPSILMLFKGDFAIKNRLFCVLCHHMNYRESFHLCRGTESFNPESCDVLTELQGISGTDKLFYVFFIGLKYTALSFLYKTS